jgi:hypothetical protein
MNLPKAIEKRLTPTQIEQILTLIEGDAEWKCSLQTSGVINLLFEKFPGSDVDKAKAANGIKSLLGDTNNKKRALYKHDELISAILIADRAICDTTFFYNERPRPSVFAYSIATWTKFGDMHDRYIQHRESYELKIVQDASNKYKRPKTAEGYALLQKFPLATREKIEGKLNDMLGMTRDKFGDDYVYRNFVRLVSDFFNEQRIYDPLVRQTPDGQPFNVLY